MTAQTTEITQRIRAHVNRGRKDWPGLGDGLVHFDCAPREENPKVADWSPTELEFFNESKYLCYTPGSWTEVEDAWARGLLSDDEYIELHDVMDAALGL
jgi:hypothetical protein